MLLRKVKMKPQLVMLFFGHSSLFIFKPKFFGYNIFYGKIQRFSVYQCSNKEDSFFKCFELLQLFLEILLSIKVSLFLLREGVSKFFCVHILLQASLWMIIFSYVGNYFWTHYFFTVLGASYTFPSWKMNNVR